MKTRRHKPYRYLITIFFNAILFYLLYLWLQKNIKLHSLISNIEQANKHSIYFIIFFYFFILAIYARRFAWLLSTSFKNAFCIIGIGSGINNLLPFRMGDILRVYFAKQFYGLDMPHTFAATFMERYFDLIILLVLGSIILFSQQFGLEVNAVYLFIILLSCSLLTVLLYRYLILKDTYLKRFFSRSEKIKNFLNAIEDVVSTPNKLPVLVASVFIWFSLLLAFYFFFSWNLPHNSIGLTGAIFLLFTTTLSFAIPYAFAGVGIFEAAVVYFLIKYLHVLPTKALALALVFHFVTAVPQILSMIMIFIAHRIAYLKSVRNMKLEERSKETSEESLS